MNINLDTVLYKLSKPILKRNEKFMNKHKNESCYILGNGASIKYFDLKKFSDKISIGIGPFDYHVDFDSLNIKYFFEGQPFFFYPYWSNPYQNKFENNLIGKFYKENFLSNPDITYFVSLSNYFGIKKDNIYFVHHFNQPFDGFDNCRLDKNFTSMSSGLAGMLGMAICLGFTDITLVGCDYSLFPQAVGHFYEYGPYENAYWSDPVNKDFLLAAMQHAEVRIVAPDDSFQGHILPSITYESLTGDKPRYRENFEICKTSGLVRLNESRMNYKIFSGV